MGTNWNPPPSSNSNATVGSGATGGGLRNGGGGRSGHTTSSTSLMPMTTGSSAAHTGHSRKVTRNNILGHGGRHMSKTGTEENRRVEVISSMKLVCLFIH